MKIISRSIQNKIGQKWDNSILPMELDCNIRYDGESRMIFISSKTSYMSKFLGIAILDSLDDVEVQLDENKIIKNAKIHEF